MFRTVTLPLGLSIRPSLAAVRPRIAAAAATNTAPAASTLDGVETFGYGTGFAAPADPLTALGRFGCRVASFVLHHLIRRLRPDFACYRAPGAI